MEFSKQMNPPEDGFDGQADIKNGWAICPYCGKKGLKIQSGTKIERLALKCRGSNCKKEFWVNV